jgi:hydroxyethylthiazole kinase
MTTYSVGGGDVRRTQVTGAGCSLGALIANAEDRITAVVAAHAVYAEAAVRASGARGTGSFATAFLDELSLIDPAA